MDQEPLVEGNPDLVNNNQVFVRRYLKIYLAITGQWFPYKSSSRLKVLYALWQLFVCCGVGAYFIIFSVVLLTKIVPTGVPYFFYYPVTTIEIIMWEFRWLITCYIGVIAYNNAMNHDNYFGSDDSVFQIHKQENALVREKYWKNVKIFLVVLGMSILLLWIATVTCSLSDINFKITRDNFLPFFIEYAIPTLFFRLLAFPLFLVLCVVIFILGSMVKQYSEQIKTWPIKMSEEYEYLGNGENGARERFKRIKICIRSAGVSFQLYLTVHFLLLLCTFFLGVCSCFEQLEVRISDNVTILSPLLLAPYSRATGFAGNFSSTEGLLMLQSVGTQGAQSGVKMVNASLGSPGKMADPKWLTRSITLIFIDMFVKTIESVVLYLVPVILMIRLENQLRHVYEAIEDSNLIQQEKKHLFIDTTKIQTMCRYIKTATGLRVFGYAVPKFNAFMLAAFGPFLAVVIRMLLLHIGMEK